MLTMIYVVMIQNQMLFINNEFNSLYISKDFSKIHTI